MIKKLLYLILFTNIILIAQNNYNNCSLVGSLKFNFQQYQDIVVFKNYLYLASESNLKAIDISNKSNPELKGTFSLNGAKLYSIVVIDSNYAILGYGNLGLVVVNIRDPSNIYEYSRINSSHLIGEIKGLSKSNDYLYALVYSYNATSGGVSVFNIQNIAEIYEVAYYKINNDAIYDCSSNGDYVYAQTYSKNLNELKLNDSDTLSFISSIETDGQATDIQYSDGYLYIANGFNSLGTGGEFLIINSMMPNSLQISKDMHVNEWCRNVFVTGNYVYVASDGNGVDIFQNKPADISDKVGYFSDDSSYTYRVTTEDKYFYVSSNEKGLFILRNNLISSVVQKKCS